MPTREQVNTAIAATKDFKGVLTVTTFDENGDNIHAANFIRSYENGRYPSVQVAEMN